VSVIRDVPKVVVPPVPPVPGVVPDPPPPPPPPIVKSLIHFTPAGVVYVPVPELNRCTVGAVAVTGFVTVIFGVEPPDEAAPPDAVTEVTQEVDEAKNPEALFPTHVEAVRALSITLRAETDPPVAIRLFADKLPAKVGLPVIVMLGVVPPELNILPDPVTAVTVPDPLPQAAAVVVSMPPTPA
jgi:hypothetical protein